MPVPFQRVYLESAGYFMPGEPIPNERMDAYIAPLNRMSERIKRRILAENGILTRHYAIDTEGVTRHTNAQLAAGAIRDCLQRGGAELSRVSLLASGSSGGDALMPGFANMIQGELAAQPMETHSVHGICAALGRRFPLDSVENDITHRTRHQRKQMLTVLGRSQ